jgi:DNA-binding transcriptional LysR family regulator
MDWNLTHVRTLQAVVGHGSFSRAAETLHLSQPAVSLHIRQLEECAGHRLLERVGKRAFPTKAGDVVLEHAARALGELEAARQALERLRGIVAGRIRVGTGATASTYLLPPLLRRLRSRYPSLELVVVTGNSAEIVAAVAANQLDLGIVTLPVSARSLAVSPLCIDPLVAIAGAGHAWRKRQAIMAADLARHPLILYERGGTIRRVIDEWFRRARVTPRVAMELGNGEAIKKLVEAGLGLSITSSMSIKAERRSGALMAMPLEPTLSRRLGIVSRRDKPDSPALRVLLAGLQKLRTPSIRSQD